MRVWLSDIRGSLSQAEMARMLGISQQMYYAIESGKRNPSVAKAQQMAQRLAIDWTKFYEPTNCKNSAT